MRRALLSLLIAVAALAGSASRAEDTPAACAQADACRFVGMFNIPGGDGKMTAVRVGRLLPWIAENNLMLFPGEAVVISLPEDAEGQLPIALVSTGEAALSRTLGKGEVRMAFSTRAGGMSLVLESGHARPLHYMAVMVTPDGKPHNTSVCVLRAGLSVFESWPHGIIQLALANFIPVEDGETFCR